LFLAENKQMLSLSASTWLKNSGYWSKRVVVRWQLLLALVVLWGASAWLRKEYGQEDSNLWLVMNTFLLLVQWTIVGLFLVSIATALLAWGYFLYLLQHKRLFVHARFGDGQKAEAGWVPVTIQLTGDVVRPMLGTVQALLVFTDRRTAAPVLLDSSVPKPRSWWRQGIRGTGRALLHDRGIYDIDHVLITFCDMLGLIALPAAVPFTQQLFTLPQPLKEGRIRAQPNATETQTYRIDIPKRVEGELVNYKEFEMGDNIHRIVWKIYAKSGQLVVRVPETKDPYASHLYFYASYFNGLSSGDGAFERELLNVYKDRVRNLLEALQRNGYEVRMPHDQEMPKLAGMSETKSELFQITAANWQKQLPPAAFVKPGNAAFVCVSSLVPAAEVEAMMRTLPGNVPMVIVKISEAIASPFRFQMKDIFFQPERQPADHLRQPWILSALRRDLVKNEKALNALMKQRDNSWLTDRIESER
jgi:uncharacterized protein (DUF58 family)